MTDYQFSPDRLLCVVQYIFGGKEVSALVPGSMEVQPALRAYFDHVLTSAQTALGFRDAGRTVDTMLIVDNRHYNPGALRVRGGVALGPDCSAHHIAWIACMIAEAHCPAGPIFDVAFGSAEEMYPEAA